MRVNNQHYLVGTLLGSDRLDILEAFTRISKSSGCNILESKLSKGGEECTLTFHISGTWSAIAKLETALPAFAEQHQFALHLKRTNPRRQTNALPYQIQVTAQDKPGILNDLAQYFTQQGIPVEKMDCETYQAKNSTTLTNIQLIVDIPVKQHIASVRDTFMVYCEDRNLDAVMEPFK